MSINHDRVRRNERRRKMWVVGVALMMSVSLILPMLIR